MSRQHGLPWTIVGFSFLALAPLGGAQEVPRGLDEALSGQAARREPKGASSPRVAIAPEFWYPSPSASDLIRELRETETTKLPSADTPYPEPDRNAGTSRSANPPLSPERTIIYAALSDPLPGTNLDRRCDQIRAEIEAERGNLPRKEAIAAACVKVWARHEGARLVRMLDPTSDVYRQRLARMRVQRRPGDTDPQIEERLKEQIRRQHLEQLLGASAIEAEVYRQRLPQLLADRTAGETEQDIERKVTSDLISGHGERLGVGSKEMQIERCAAQFWPHRAASDRNQWFDRVSHDMLRDRRIWVNGRERLIHYVRARDPRLTYQQARELCGRSAHGKPPQIYTEALELVRQERTADLLMRLAEMNAWETAGRGTPGAYRQVEALMNRALDAAVRTNPRAEERRRYYQTQLHFTKEKADEAVREEFKTEFLLRLNDSPRDERPNEAAPDEDPAIAEERNVPEAPLHPEFRVKQFVRENRRAQAVADAAAKTR
jgi:hypothetical protein